MSAARVLADGFARRRRRWLIPATAICVVVAIGWRSCFVVEEGCLAVVQGAGRGSGPGVVPAGFSVKWPWQSVRHLDQRVRLLQLKPRERLTADHEPLVLQPCVCWRLSSEGAEQFLQSVGDVRLAESQLADLVWRELDREWAARRLVDWLHPAGDRDSSGDPPLLAIAARVARGCQAEAFARFGLDLLDVQLQRVGRPEGMTCDLLRLMQADRQRQIDRRRLEIEQQQAGLIADARRRADRILAEADVRAERVLAEGRDEAIRLENEARALSSDLTDYLLLLRDYRKLIASGSDVESKGPASQPVGPSPRPATP